MCLNLICAFWLRVNFLQAIRDGNKIWATLKTATNQDGRCAQPITAPSEKQQLDLLERIYKTSGVAKDNIQVIESHGNL